MADMSEADLVRLIRKHAQPLPTKRPLNEVTDLLTVSGDLSLSTRARNRIIAGGTVNIAWPGGANISTSTTVTHGFKVTPTSVVGTFGTINNTGGGTLVNVCAVQIINIGATTFDIRCQYLPLTNPAATAANTVTWMAIL